MVLYARMVRIIRFISGYRELPGLDWIAAVSSPETKQV